MPQTVIELQQLTKLIKNRKHNSEIASVHANIAIIAPYL